MVLKSEFPSKQFKLAEMYLKATQTNEFKNTIKRMEGEYPLSLFLSVLVHRFPACFFCRPSSLQLTFLIDSMGSISLLQVI